MLHSLNDLFGFRLFAHDDEPVGVVTDLLFDERASVTRYVLIEPEDWMPGGDLLIAPAALEAADSAHRRLVTLLPRPELAAAPRPATSTAPSRIEEERLHAHFRWQPYWINAVVSDLAAYWGAAGGAREVVVGDEPGAERLRGARDILGFEVEATDGSIGRVDDLIVGLATWTFRYLVVDTGSWLPGRRVLASPQWLSRTDWAARTLRLDLASERLASAPAYDRETVLDRGFEEALHAHVGRPGYW